MIFVVAGPGGAGKGTAAARLVEADPELWLSRSWTTRPPRDGEDPEAYVFVDQEEFDRKAGDGGFLEHAEFLGHCYGTPIPDPPAGADVLLEIELQGARQIKELRPDAVVILFVPPSLQVQADRMRSRGDDPDSIDRRIAKGEEETAELRTFADHEVVNDDIDRAVGTLAAILALHRGAA